ncbi:hypothetical protein, partial [Phascolarctobacterium succinatutens]|uniref:hypothetical protein n=1 Tax=Phascolarctobacterium succinatutens TaxID=626940 RepID=UPI003AF060C6
LKDKLSPNKITLEIGVTPNTVRNIFLLKQIAACLTADGACFFPLFLVLSLVFQKSFPYFGGFSKPAYLLSGAGL